MIEHDRFDIRWTIRRDLPELVDISKHAFEHPTTEEDFQALLRQRNVIGKVLMDKDDEDILAYSIYRIGDKECMTLTDFAVHHSVLRMGFGSMLMSNMLTKSRNRDYKRIRIVIRERNLSALLFFKSAGFVANQGVLRRHFGELDGIPMEFDLCRDRDLLLKRNEILGEQSLRS